MEKIEPPIVFERYKPIYPEFLRKEREENRRNQVGNVNLPSGVKLENGVMS